MATLSLCPLLVWNLQYFHTSDLTSSFCEGHNGQAEPLDMVVGFGFRNAWKVVRFPLWQLKMNQEIRNCWQARQLYQVSCEDIHDYINNGNLP